MLVDVHAHFCPEEYRMALAEAPASLPARLAVLTSAPAAMADADVRLAALDQAGIDLQVLSVPAPNLLAVADPGLALHLCQAANDGLAALSRRHPRRFRALGTVPLEHPAAAADELRRAVRSLGLPGVMVGANVSGAALDDARLEPFWAVADELGAIVYLHPTERSGWDGFEAFELQALLGYLFDSSLAAARLFLAGHLERHGRLRLVLPHLGGTLPYVLARLDRGYRTREACRALAPHPPSHYLGRCHLDTVQFHGPSLRAAREVVGAGRLLLGSDAPHPIGGMADAVAAVTALGLSPGEQAAVLGDNAAMLLGL